MRTRLATLILTLVMVCPLTGCSYNEPAILPGSGPLCEVFPTDQIAAMLPPGTYDYTDGQSNRIHYYEGIILDGACFIETVKGAFHRLYVETREHHPSTRLDKDCRASTLDGMVTPPQVGEILDSGQCPGVNSDRFHEAWVLYWGGDYDSFGNQLTTLIDVRLSYRIGADGLTNSTAVMQMVLDYIDQSYAATPPSDAPQSSPSTVPSPMPPTPEPS